MHIGSRIRLFRHRAQICQLQMEVDLDMSPGSLSRIETGKVDPGKTTVIKIARYLNLTDHEFLYIIGWHENMQFGELS